MDRPGVDNAPKIPYGWLNVTTALERARQTVARPSVCFKEDILSGYNGLVIDPSAGGAPTNSFTWADNGAGGVNYYNNGSPINREAFQSGVTGSGDTQTNVGQIENWVAQNFANQHQNTGGVANTGGASVSPGGGAQYGYTQVTNPAYSQYMNSLNSMYGNLDAQQNNQTQMIGNNYDTNLSGLNSQFQQGNANLDQSGKMIDQNQANSLRDLSSNLRNSFQQAQNQLGNLGAGDSSAVDQYSYALTKSGNQSRGDLLQQTGNQRANLDLQRNSLSAQNNQQINQLNTWKSNALLGLQSQYAQQRAQLDSLRSQAPAQYAQQLSQLNNATMSQLSNVDQAMQAAQASLGGSLGNPGLQGLDLSGTQVQPANLNVAPIQGSMNFMQNTPNVGQLQQAAPVNYLQGSTGTARVKQPWEY